METNVNTLVHPRQPWLEAVRMALALPIPVPGRPYFRCFPLSATLSAGQCRANRSRVPADIALRLPFELLSWQILPPACASCGLATAMEAGGCLFSRRGKSSPVCPVTPIPPASRCPFPIKPSP